MAQKRGSRICSKVEEELEEGEAHDERDFAQGMECSSQDSN